MKFHQYVALKEADLNAELDAIFKQTSADIDRLFDQLYKGAQGMVKGSERAQLPDELKQSIMDDLNKIARKVKGPVPPQNQRLDPRTRENVMVQTYINDIMETVSAVDGLGRMGTGSTGKPVYDFKSALTNVKNMVMDRMGQLRNVVMRSLGTIGDIHGKIGDIHGNVVTALKPDERESAEDGLVALSGLTGPHAIKLFAGVNAQGQPTNPIQFNAQDRQSMRTALNNINPKKVYAMVDGQLSPIDLTNRQAWTDLQTHAHSNVHVPTYGPVSGNKLRTRKIKDASPGGITVNQSGLSAPPQS